MATGKMLMAASVEADTRPEYRAGGVAGIVLGIMYVVITALYVVGGALPGGVEEALTHLAGHAASWWAILGLSVVTDLLFLPIAWALYVALKEVDRAATLVGTGFLVLFVALDLAVTWPNYASLLVLGGEYVAATDGARQAAIVGAATYASSVLATSLWAVYAILVPSLGILVLGLVMRKGPFSRAVAILGVATGILGIVAVAGPFFVAALGTVAILASVLTTVWVFLVGYRLLRLSRM